MNKPAYGYVKPKHDEKAKLCFMGTESSILYIKIGSIYKYIPKNAEIKFDTLN